jgi:subtilisin family serine protease
VTGSIRRRRLTVSVLTVSLATCLLPAVAVSATPLAPVSLPGTPWPDDAVPGSLLVTRDDGQSEVVHVSPGEERAAAARLRAQPGIVAVEPDALRHALLTPDDSGYAQQWSHTVANAPAAWDITTGSTSVEVAVIDTGIDARHPDLAANIVDQYDVSSGSAIRRGTGVDNDACDIGHGTLVAGAIGAVGNNATGVAGVAWHVGIVDIASGDPVRCGLFADSGVLTGMQLAIERGVDVINLSLGGLGDTCPTAFQNAIDTARAAGFGRSQFVRSIG